MSYVYKRTEPTLFTVGFYDPNNGGWHPDSDYTDREEAAARAAWLNGSGRARHCRPVSLSDPGHGEGIMSLHWDEKRKGNWLSIEIDDSGPFHVFVSERATPSIVAALLREVADNITAACKL